MSHLDESIWISTAPRQIEAFMLVYILAYFKEFCCVSFVLFIRTPTASGASSVVAAWEKLKDISVTARQ